MFTLLFWKKKLRSRVKSKEKRNNVLLNSRFTFKPTGFDLWRFGWKIVRFEGGELSGVGRCLHNHLKTIDFRMCHRLVDFHDRKDFVMLLSLCTMFNLEHSSAKSLWFRLHRQPSSQPKFSAVLAVNWFLMWFLWCHSHYTQNLFKRKPQGARHSWLYKRWKSGKEIDQSSKDVGTVLKLG